MHNSSCIGEWHLVENAITDVHRCSCFYLGGEQGIYYVRNCVESPDIVFNKQGGETVQTQHFCHQHALDDALNEIELMSFSVCDVFNLVDADLNKYLPAKALQENQNKEVTVIGFLITSKPVHTIKQETMFFHTFIDPSGD